MECTLYSMECKKTSMECILELYGVSKKLFRVSMECHNISMECLWSVKRCNVYYKLVTYLQPWAHRWQNAKTYATYVMVKFRNLLAA